MPSLASVPSLLCDSIARMGAQSLIIGASFRRPLLSLPVDRPRRRPNHSALTTSSSAARNSGGAEASLALSERCRGTDDGQLVLAIGSELFSQELRKIEIANPNVLHNSFLNRHEGNWADFEARMGVRDVTDEPNRPAYALPVVFPGTPPSEARHYVVDTNRRGTIVDLFTRYLCGPAGEQLQRGSPRELHLL